MISFEAASMNGVGGGRGVDCPSKKGKKNGMCKGLKTESLVFHTTDEKVRVAEAGLARG